MTCSLAAAILFFNLTGPPSPAPSVHKPNVILILADDLGSGDLRVMNPDSRIPTPNLDALARSGARFTDAHSPSAVCTPTRYGILTGRYCWRSDLKSGVLWGRDPLLIEDDRPTIASALDEVGYHTAFVGKWHLGLGSEKREDWTEPFDKGPHTVGFDESIGIPSSLDIPPYCWVRNGQAAFKPASIYRSPTFGEVFMLPDLVLLQYSLLRLGAGGLAQVLDRVLRLGALGLAHDGCF